MNSFPLLSRGLLSLSLALALLPACKDDTPCDEGQEAIGTGCFPQQSGGSGGTGDAPQAGAPADEGGAGPSAGNPDATFGTPCESDAECGGDAPVCDFKVFHYCLQTECKEGEANEGACPEGWQCVLVPPNPSACIRQQ